MLWHSCSLFFTKWCSMNSLVKLLKYIPLAVEAFIYIRDFIKRVVLKRDTSLSDSPIADQIATPLQEVLAFLESNLGKLQSGEGRFVKDILSTVGSGDLSPFAKVVKDALADGQLTRKEIALIILAYEMKNETISGHDLTQSAEVAEYLGYKTPTAVAMQVGRKVANLTQIADQ